MMDEQTIAEDKQLQTSLALEVLEHVSRKRGWF